MKKNTFLCLFLCFQLSLMAQKTALDAYVSTAIETNHGLKQEQFLLERNILALEEAKKLHRPDVSFGTSYTIAAGGRSIDFPIGDLLNGVYATLNQLTKSQSFPQLENQSVNFLPNNFYDARFRMRVPILQQEIKYYQAIKKGQISLKELEIAAFKKELAKDVKLAFFQYQQANAAVKIYDEALKLIAENQRIAESLLRNGVALPSLTIRIQAEESQVAAKRSEAQTNAQNALAYFNFLLNQPSDKPLESVENWTELPTLPTNIEISNREELKQLEKAKELKNLALDVEKQYYKPKIGAQADVGSQAFNFGWQPYFLGAVSLEIPIWDNKKNHLRQEQLGLEVKATQEQLLQVQQQLQLQAQTLYNSLKNDISRYESFTPISKSMNRLHSDALKRFKEGQANYIEVLDARNQVTNIELQRNIARFQAWGRWIELERCIE